MYNKGNYKQGEKTAFRMGEDTSKWSNWQTTNLKNILAQSHSHQDSMVLAQRQTYRSMELNRKPRDKSTHIWTPYLWQRRQEYTMEKRQISLTSGAGKTGQPLVKEWN